MAGETATPTASPAPAPVAATPAPAPAPAAAEFREIVFMLPNDTQKVDEPAKVVSTPAKADADEGEGAPTNDSQVVDQARDSKGRFKPSAQERIDELTRKSREAERSAEYWRSRATAQAPAPAPAPAPEKPKRADFVSDDEFIEALTDFKLAQALPKLEKTTDEKVQAVNDVQVWNERLKQARSDIQDFDQVMQSAEVVVEPHVARMLMVNKHGAELAYALAKTPEKLIEINNMTVEDAAFELGQILVGFKSARSAPAQAPAPSPAPSPAPAPVTANPPAAPSKVTTAPDPIQAAAAAAIASGVQKSDPSQMSMEEYRQWRKGQSAWWA